MKYTPVLPLPLWTDTPDNLSSHFLLLFVPLWLIPCLSARLRLLPRCHPPSVCECVLSIALTHLDWPVTDTLLRSLAHMHPCADWGCENHLCAHGRALLGAALVSPNTHTHAHTHHHLTCWWFLSLVKPHKHRETWAMTVWKGFRNTDASIHTNRPVTSLTTNT